MVFLYLMGQSPVPAVIAITIHTTGVLGKLFSEAIENADMRPVEGLQSAGASWFSRVRFGVLTQVLPLFFSYTLLRVEINVRASTILGFVGAGGIGEALSAMIQWRHGDQICAIIVLIVATITALDYLSSYVRNRFIGYRP
jgi:phosphonate transport system permease protein